MSRTPLSRPVRSRRTAAASVVSHVAGGRERGLAGHLRNAAGTAAARILSLSGLLVLALLSATAPAAVAAAPVPAGVPSSESIMDDVRALVELGPRRSGTPGGDRAAEYMKAGLAKAGIPKIWEQNVPTYQWEETHHKVTVGGQPIDAFPSEHSFLGKADRDWTGSFSTGPGGRTAKVVDIGDGGVFDLLGKDLRGKIVVFNLRFLAPNMAMALGSEFLYDPNLSLLQNPRALAQANPYISNYVSVLRAAQRAGAVGFIGVLTDYFESNRYRNEYYQRLQVVLPGFWVTRAEGTRLRSLLPKAGGKATLELEGRRYQAPTRTVLGYLPGKSRETIMVQSHHDSVGPGAVEDASGSAEVLALARYYAGRPASERERGLLFVTFDSHFTGYHSHGAFLRDYVLAQDRPYDIVANATVEHIARQGVVKGGKLTITGQTEPRAFFRNGGNVVKQAIVEAIRKYDLRRTIVINARAVTTDGNIPTDAAGISMVGVPTASFVSGPIYLYDDMDTIDKVDKEQLQPVAAAFVDIIDRFDITSARALKGR